MVVLAAKPVGLEEMAAAVVRDIDLAAADLAAAAADTAAAAAGMAAAAADTAAAAAGMAAAAAGTAVVYCRAVEWRQKL